MARRVRNAASGVRRRLKRKTNSPRLGLQVRAVEPVIDAECRGFEVGEDTR